MLLLSMACSAESSCPWLNTATASGVLGGAVNVTVTGKDGEKVTTQNASQNAENITCDFVRRQGLGIYSLRIAVMSMISTDKEFSAYKHSCATAAMALKDIGNEAITCAIPNTAGTLGQMVISRVRNRAFLVVLSTNTSDDPVWTTAYLREKSEDIAEQIAGNLF